MTPTQLADKLAELKSKCDNKEILSQEYVHYIFYILIPNLDTILRSLRQGEGIVRVPVEPTRDMLDAMAASQAKDDEGVFPMLTDILDYSGENKTRAVLKAAYVAAVNAASPVGVKGDR